MPLMKVVNKIQENYHLINMFCCSFCKQIRKARADEREEIKK